MEAFYGEESSLVNYFHARCLRQHLHGWEHECAFYGAFVAELAPSAAREIIDGGLISLIGDNPSLVRGFCILRGLPPCDLAQAQTKRQMIASYLSATDAEALKNVGRLEAERAGNAPAVAPSISPNPPAAQAPEEPVSDALEKRQDDARFLERGTARHSIFKREVDCWAWSEPKHMSARARALGAFINRAESAIQTRIRDESAETAAREALEGLPAPPDALQLLDGLQRLLGARNSFH